MLIWYFIYFVAVIGLAVSFKKGKKDTFNYYCLFILVFAALLSGFRGDMGADYLGYRMIFEETPDLFEWVVEGKKLSAYYGLEYGYSLIISIFKTFTTKLNLFYFFQTVVIYILIIAGVKRYEGPMTASLAFYTLLFFPGHFGQQRMAIIYSATFFLSSLILKRQWRKFHIGVIGIALVQYTALAFMPAYIVLKSLVPVNYTNSKGLYVPFLILLFIFAFVLLLTLRFNIFQILFDVVGGAVSGGNILVYKFTSYFVRIEEDMNILNAIFGLVAHLGLIVILFIYRNIWLDSSSARLFVLYFVGFILFVLTYKFPWLSDRVFRMYSVPAQIVVFAKVLNSSRSDSVMMKLALIIIVSYLYFSFIQSETGPYIMFKLSDAGISF
ncbi:MAG: hypothetical protein ACI8Q1_002025 [Parvicella sp.]|jgi:hypothetical protein